MLLTDEDIESIENIGHNEPDASNNTEGFEEFWMHEDTLKRVAKAQLKQVVKWMRDRKTAQYNGLVPDLIIISMSFEDWQSLLEEVKE